MQSSRTRNAGRNIIYGFLYKIIVLLMPFVLRTVIINYLGKEYLGLNTMFASILEVLNMAELGFSSAMVYSMYKPAAENDTDKINALLNFYKKVYLVIGIIILISGLIIMPFLPNFIADKSIPGNLNVYLLFFMYLLSIVISYVTVAYKGSLFLAFQRVDISTKINGFILLFRYSIQIILIITTKNYYLNILMLPIFQILTNLIVYFFLKKMYPEYHCSGKLDKKTKKSIRVRVFSLFGHKLSDKVLTSVDSLMISTFLGLSILAMFDNYNYIQSSVGGLIIIIYTSILPGIGNSVVKESIEKNKRDFNILTFTNTWLIGWASICILCLVQWFIGNIWLDESFLFGISTVILVPIYFYSYYIRRITLTYKDALGMWKEDWLKPYIIVLLNISLNLLLVNLIGINGILISTILINFFIAFPWENIVLFKHYFKEGVLKYFIKQIIYLFVFVGMGIGMYFLCNIFSFSFLNLIIVGCMLIVIPNLVFIFINIKNEDFIMTKNYLFEKMKRRKKNE